jgi:hypothetical protein
MARTDQDFVDGLALDLFSPTNRTLVVTNNTSPLPGNFVTGSSGEGFINLSKYSWIIKLNETAKDLIAKIELPYDPVALRQQGVDISNTYVGTLASDGKSWVIAETQRNVHVYVPSKPQSSNQQSKVIVEQGLDVSDNRPSQNGKQNPNYQDDVLGWRVHAPRSQVSRYHQYLRAVRTRRNSYG